MTRGQVGAALHAACATVGRVELDAPAWNRLGPLVHALARRLDGMPGPEGWPAEPVVAPRRLAVAVRRWTARQDVPRGEESLVLALAGWVEEVVAGSDPRAEDRTRPGPGITLPPTRATRAASST